MSLFKDLCSALGLGPGENVAVVGAGGKTTLMFALAHELLLRGLKVITTTTTKVSQEEAEQSPGLVMVDEHLDWLERVRRDLETHGHVFVAAGFPGSFKLKGVPPSLADMLFQESGADCLLVEADGAAGRPVKAPAGHEPVIPSSSTVVVALMGLEALGKPVSSELVFRMDLLVQLSGLSPGDYLSPDGIARVFHDSRGLYKGSPEAARRVAFLNKADLLCDMREARKLAGLLINFPDSQIERAVIADVRHKSLPPEVCSMEAH